MRVQTEEWRRFIPGVRMYKGKLTCFYNGEKLWNPVWEDYDDMYADLNHERENWEVIIVLPGVEVIPELTFVDGEKVETVIMSDSVRRIEKRAFGGLTRLSYVRLSTNLQFIGKEAFYGCRSLTSIYIPPSCGWIGSYAFAWCKELIIFHVPQQTQLRQGVISSTKLLETSPHESNIYFEETNDWIRNINRNEEFELHRACSSYNPMEDIVYGIVRRKGLGNFKVPNSIGISPMQYLEANPYADIDQHKLIKRYIGEMTGETII